MDPGTKFDIYIYIFSLDLFSKLSTNNSALLIPLRWASARWVWPCLRMAAVRPLMNQPMASLERTAPGLWSWSCRARHKRRPKPCWEEGWGWVGWVGLAVRYRFWAGWVGEKWWWEVGNGFWGWWAQIFFGDETVVTLETEKSMRLLVREIVPVKTG